MTVVTKPFTTIGDAVAKGFGWIPAKAVVDHPLVGISEEELSRRAQEVVACLADHLSGEQTSNADSKQDVESNAPLTAIIEVPNDPWQFFDYIQNQGWGDGLPVFAPTAERVAMMLSKAGIAPDVAVGQMPPRNLIATAQDVATNAVMAGCLDEAFPIVLAALRLATRREFNLQSIMTTTHPCTLTTIVSGPIAKELGINAGASAFGPGNRMNATIGRAVRLAAQNLGHCWTGAVDKATHGSPAKYGFCFAENLEESPWTAYHVDRGFNPSVSTVTVVPSEGPQNIKGAANSSAESLLMNIAASLAHPGSNNVAHRGDPFLILGIEHAGIFANEGWSRDRVRNEVFERALMKADSISKEQFDYGLARYPGGHPELDYETAQLTITAKPEDINIVVAGGAGKHSASIPTFDNGVYSVIGELGKDC